MRGNGCPCVHDKGKKGRPSQTNGMSKGRRRSTPTTRIISPGKGKTPACRFHLKGKCSEGGDCACWHAPHSRFFKNGYCIAREKCQFVHIGSTVAPATVGDAGGRNNGDEKKPKRRGRSPTPKSPKSGTEGPATVCISSRDVSKEASGGETPAMASTTGEASYIAKINNKVRFIHVAMVQTCPFEG